MPIKKGPLRSPRAFRFRRTRLSGSSVDAGELSSCAAVDQSHATVPLNAGHELRLVEAFAQFTHANATVLDTGQQVVTEGNNIQGLVRRVAVEDGDVREGACPSRWSAGSRTQNERFRSGRTHELAWSAHGAWTSSK